MTSQPMPPPGAPAAPPAQKSKTWLYVLLGCGGCSMVAVVFLAVGMFFAVRKGTQGVSTFVSTTVLDTQKGELDARVKDMARRDRIDKAYTELGSMASNGELKMGEVTRLHDEVEEVIRGKDTLSDDEADQIAEKAETLAGSR